MSCGSCQNAAQPDFRKVAGSVNNVNSDLCLKVINCLILKFLTQFLVVNFV